MKISKRFATHGLNVSMSVFIGLSVFGFIKYAEGGFTVVPSPFSLSTVLLAVFIVASIAGICFFGHQLDLRNLAIHREEETRKAAEEAKQGRRKPARRS
ncbi:MAG: hypothetical protein IH610_03345 [Deltaproteobacteria bacterium]|nr:hypothetical protein [Deltaproteobacteria bacterium]